MLRIFGIVALFGVMVFASMGCYDSAGVQDDSIVSAESSSQTGQINFIQEGDVVLYFSVDLNPDIYERSDWGEPPQVAIWLEDSVGKDIRTVFVTYRSATGDWMGKVSCPVALPYWFSRYNKETGTVGPPTYRNPAPHAVTGATPTLELTARTGVAPKSEWSYFIEVNVAGDYNRDFPSMLESGRPDPQGNGQPSLIYKGTIIAEPGSHSTPVLVGRTEQWSPTDTIIEDLRGITTAKELLGKIEVTCP